MPKFSIRSCSACSPAHLRHTRRAGGSSTRKRLYLHNDLLCRVSLTPETRNNKTKRNDCKNKGRKTVTKRGKKTFKFFFSCQHFSNSTVFNSPKNPLRISLLCLVSLANHPSHTGENLLSVCVGDIFLKGRIFCHCFYTNGKRKKKKRKKDDAHVWINVPQRPDADALLFLFLDNGEKKQVGGSIADPSTQGNDDDHHHHQKWRRRRWPEGIWRKRRNKHYNWQACSNHDAWITRTYQERGGGPFSFFFFFFAWNIDMKERKKWMDIRCIDR